MDHFKTTGNYSKKLIFLSSLSPLPLFHRIFYGLCFAYALYTLFLSCRYFYPIGTAVSFFLLLCTLRPVIRAWQATRVALKRTAELTSNTSITSFFEEDGFHVIGVSGNENTLPYNVIRAAHIHRDFIIIISKARQCAPVFHNELSPEHQRALLEHLRQKSIRISGKLK